MELDGDYLSLSVQLIPRGELMLVPLDSLPSHSGDPSSCLWEYGELVGVERRLPILVRATFVLAHNVHGSWLDLDGDCLSLSVQLILRGELMLVPLDSFASFRRPSV